MYKFPTIEPNLGRFEFPYRQAFLRGDAVQAIFVIVLSNIASLLLINSDYQSHGLEAKFYMFLTARLSVAIVSIVAVVILFRSAIPKYHDMAVAGYMIAGALINIFINTINPPSYEAYIGVSIILINIYYFALFTPLHIRVAIAAFFSAVTVFQAYQSPLPDESKTVIAGMHFLTNIIGLFISARLYTLRRLSFKSHAEEIELKLELSKLANLDPLTNLNNRRSFTEAALDEFNRAKRYNRVISLMLIDIDRLKTINDTHGHLAGDEVIRYCSSVMKGQIRQQDKLGRLGGDEFGILLPETELPDAIALGNRILQNCRSDYSLANGGRVDLTLSMGLTEISTGDKNYEDLFKRTDEFLYIAKNNGRNQIVFEEKPLKDQHRA